MIDDRLDNYSQLRRQRGQLLGRDRRRRHADGFANFRLGAKSNSRQAVNGYLPGLLEYVSVQLKRDAAADSNAVKSFVINELKSELAVQINDRATFQVQQLMNSFGGVADRKGNEEAFVDAVTKHLKQINPQALYSEAEALFRDIINKQDYGAVLKYYNRKSLASRISCFFGLKHGEYPKYVLRLLQGSDGNAIRDILLAATPSLSMAP